MYQKHFALAAAALLLSAGASAQVGVTADLGTTGIGAHLVLPMETSLNGRFGINYFTHDFSKMSDHVNYEVKGKLQSIDLLFDWYLREGSNFRLTGGVLYNGNRFSAEGRPDADGKIRLNNKLYPSSLVGKLIGTVDYRKAAPYIGIGWGNALAPTKSRNGGWHVNADVGVFYQGNSNVKLESVGCNSIAAVCNLVASDVAVERARLQDDLGDFKLFPVIRASISYGF
jgi:hypothetical protein